MTPSTDAVLAAIDSAVEDWEGSPDAARWHPDGVPDELAAPLELGWLTPGQLAGLSHMAASVSCTMSEFGQRIIDAFAPMSKAITELAASAAHAQDAAERPRWHRRKCRTCNPAGNPLGDPAGRGYHLRQMARRRRRRR